MKTINRANLKVSKTKAGHFHISIDGRSCLAKHFTQPLLEKLQRCGFVDTLSSTAKVVNWKFVCLVLCPLSYQKLLIFACPNIFAS